MRKTLHSTGVAAQGQAGVRRALLGGASPLSLLALAAVGLPLAAALVGVGSILASSSVAFAAGIGGGTGGNGLNGGAGGNSGDNGHNSAVGGGGGGGGGSQTPNGGGAGGAGGTGDVPGDNGGHGGAGGATTKIVTTTPVTNAIAVTGGTGVAGGSTGAGSKGGGGGGGSGGYAVDLQVGAGTYTNKGTGSLTGGKGGAGGKSGAGFGGNGGAGGAGLGIDASNVTVKNSGSIAGGNGGGGGVGGAGNGAKGAAGAGVDVGVGGTVTGVTIVNGGTISGGTAAAPAINILNGSSVTFTSSNATSGLKGNIAVNGALTLSQTANSTTIANVITDGAGGAGGVKVKATGGNVVTLSGKNTFSGATTITAGTLALSGTGSIADSKEVELATGGKLDISQTTSGASVVTLGNTAAGQTGTVYLGAQTLTISNGSTTFGGVIADKGGIKNVPGGGLTLLAGTETLTGANTYTGLTTIKGGTLALSGTGSIADSKEVELATGGKLDISQTTSGASVVTLGNTAAGQTGTVYLGAQTLTISNGSTTFGGVIADKAASRTCRAAG